MKLMTNKSNRNANPARARRFFTGLSRLLSCHAGQGTVEYMLIIIILVVPMAAALAVLFDAFQVLHQNVGYLLGRPYP